MVPNEIFWEKFLLEYKCQHSWESDYITRCVWSDELARCVFATGTVLSEGKKQSG